MNAVAHPTPPSSLELVFFTKTHGPDLQYTKELLASLEHVGSSFEHLVVVDDADYSEALRLLGSSVQLERTSSIMPRGLARTLKQTDRLRVRGASGDRRRLALLGLTAANRIVGPSDGWWSQQVVKLAVARHHRQTTFVHLDSDLVFLTRPEASWFTESGRPRLFCRPAPSLKEVEWKLRAHRIFGLDRYSDAPTTFTVLPQVVHSPLVIEMLDYLDDSYSGPWWRTMLKERVTEYELYGTYAAHVANGVLGAEVCSWSFEVSAWQPDASLKELRRRVRSPGQDLRVLWLQSKLPELVREDARRAVDKLA